ncbi:hypothetical protein NEOLEDRAFT_1243110 [Neolentinus lepideus HHB14362 ss-1]|uniref:Uncharacterized protein n=1 Tax=Neolentinus lepideus HHB14362 ss-1 TaxID=1314782 RepID=A0A165R9Y3_9AGAM|nr:hypothetical protein NEOLEDRAFT_1243110 [Neolentinus lepideus HHB14362 ss-1]
MEVVTSTTLEPVTTDLSERQETVPPRPSLYFANQNRSTPAASHHQALIAGHGSSKAIIRAGTDPRVGRVADGDVGHLSWLIVINRHIQGTTQNSKPTSQVAQMGITKTTAVARLCTMGGDIRRKDYIRQGQAMGEYGGDG